ncbi:MAG: hypothetical protein ACJAWW_000787 [Sulfurimonas sp.]
MINLIKSKDFYILFGLYFLSNAFFILNIEGVYWDGWVAFKQTDETITLLFQQIQHGIKGDFFLLLSHIGNGIISFRIFVFVAIFTIGILLYLILQNIKELDKNALFFITLIFIVIPVNSAKISISVIPFLFPVLLFYIAFYLLSVYLKKPSIQLRLIVLIVFFTSFSTNSILVFYFSIFFYIYYFKFNFSHTKYISKIKIIIIKYWDFILLPFIYFIYKSIYLKPTGLYEGYNSISISNVLNAIKILFLNVDNSFIQVIYKSIYSTSAAWIYIFILLFFIVRKRNDILITEKNNIFFFVGIVLFFLAIFPYAMVSKNAEFESWNSRFQILTPLGLSFILYFGLISLKKLSYFNNKVLLIIIWLLIFSFVSKNISFQYEALKDHFYSVSIGENIRDNQQIKENTTFIVNNNLTDSYLYNRRMIYYELNGIFKKSFKDEKRLAIRYDHYIDGLPNMDTIKKHKQYNFSEWKHDTPLLVTLSHNYKVRFGQNEYIELIYLNLFDKKQFLARAKQLTHITVEELPMHSIKNTLNKD